MARRRSRTAAILARHFHIALVEHLADQLLVRALRFGLGGKLFGLRLAGRANPSELDRVGAPCQTDTPELVGHRVRELKPSLAHHLAP
jgi:hypothetical protein